MAGPAPLAGDGLLRRQLQDPAIPDVGDDDVPIGQRIGVVGRMEAIEGRATGVVAAVLPDHLPGRDIDPVDHLVRLVVRDDRLAVRRQEGVVGRKALAPRQALRSWK